MLKKVGIVLAGGKGTRLSPLTDVVNKQLLPVYDKPVIFYPLQTLKEMGYTDILIIAGSEEQKWAYQKLLKRGNQYDLNLAYAVQDYPKGLPDAFNVWQQSGYFMDAKEICLILGDNIFINEKPIVSELNKIFTYRVKDPSQYGVVTRNSEGNIKELVEKPKKFVSDEAVVGLYIFGPSVLDALPKLEPSARGELEIVELIAKVNEKQPIKVEELDGFWFDVGSHDSLLDCGNLVRTIRNRTTRKLGL